MATLHKRPTTPGKSSPNVSSSPPMPDLPKDVAAVVATTKKDDKKDGKRSSLAFLRRSKSSAQPPPPVPAIPQIAPRLPDLFNGGSPPPPIRTFGGSPINGDSLMPIREPQMSSTELSRKSTDTGVSGVGSMGYNASKPRDGESEDTVGSMAHRGRYNYNAGNTAGVNGPRRVRRRKDPTPFNILVLGARGSGKTSFIKFLAQSLASTSTSSSSKRTGTSMEPTPEETTKPALAAANSVPKSAFTKTYLETEIDGERIGLTLWDSAGFEANLVDLQLRETLAFLEAKFEETFTEENKVARSPGVRDTHIHCAFHLVDPARLDASLVRTHSTGEVVSGGLDAEMDLQVLRALRGVTTVVPVIAKADTVTGAHMAVLKHLVRGSLRENGLDPLEAMELDLEAYGITEAAPVPAGVYQPEGQTAAGPAISSTSSATTASTDDSSQSHHHRKEARDPDAESLAASSMAGTSNIDFLPLSILSPDPLTLAQHAAAAASGNKATLPPLGRHFPWGFADPFNAEHCDFTALRDAVFSEWRADLRETAREVGYEGWRTRRLEGGGLRKGGVVARRASLVGPRSRRS